MFDGAQQQLQTGTVVATGQGRGGVHSRMRDSPVVTVGEHILCRTRGGTEIRYQGDDYLIVPTHDVLAVLTVDTAADLRP